MMARMMDSSGIPSLCEIELTKPFTGFKTSQHDIFTMSTESLQVRWQIELCKHVSAEISPQQNIKVLR